MTESECGSLMVRLILYEALFLFSMVCIGVLIVLFRR